MSTHAHRTILLAGLLSLSPSCGPLLSPARAEEGAKPTGHGTGEQAGPVGKAKRRGKAGARKRAAKRPPRKQTSAPQEVQYARRFLARGAYRQLLIKTEQRLEKVPESGALHAVRMVACGHFGDHACVLESHDLAAPTEILTHVREESLANALHQTGAHEEAAELRRTAIWEDTRPLRTEWNFASLFFDLESTGDTQAACEVAWQAVAHNPEAATPWALVARCAAETGDLEEAESYLWLADRTQQPSVTLSSTRIDLHRLLGDPEHAAALARRPTRTQQKSLRHTVARHRALLSVRDPMLVIDSFDMGSWSLDGEIWHPELLKTYEEAFAQAGHPAIAAELADRLEQLTPH